MTEPTGDLVLAHAAHMPAPQGGALPTGLEWQALERMAGTLATSSLVPYQLRGKPGDVAVILLAAREYGIPPLMALSKLPVVNGKPAPMGELMVALVLRAGHSIRAEFRTPDGERYKGGPLSPQHYGEAIVRRRDWPTGVEESLTFTLAEGIAAGLLTIDRDGNPHAEDSKGRPTPWQQYTPNMARWRAVANVCRLYFPDVLMGLSYLPEELGAVVDEDGAPIMGTVVEEPRRQTTGGTLEERTAQEAADRLADYTGPVEVLDNVTAHAEANGYADALVTYAGDRVTLAAAIAAKRTELDAIIDVDTTDDTTTETPEAPTETPTAPQEAAQPVAAPEAHPSGETPQEAAYDVAREVLKCGDVELLRSYYRGAASEDLAALDVLPVVTDADLATLGAPPTLTALPLGALIMRAGEYVTEQGIAVADPLPDTTPDPTDPDDPWTADDTATAQGWAQAHPEGD